MEDDLIKMLFVCFERARDRHHGTLVYQSFDQWIETVSQHAKMLEKSLSEYLLDLFEEYD